MVHHDLPPRLVEVRLLEENIRRERGGLSTFQYFIPYQFLKHRVADPNPDDMSGDGPYNPLNRADVSANNQLRSALRRYIFIRSSDRELERFLEENSGRESCRTLWYYRDRDRNRLTVSDSAMGSFIDACCDRRIRFDAEAPPSPSASAYFRACSSSASPPSAWRTYSTSRRTPPPWYARTTATSWWRTPSVRSSASCPAVSKADRPGSPAPGTSPCSSPSTTTATACSMKDVRRELDEVDSRPRSKVSVSVRAFMLSALYLATKEPLYYKEATEYFHSQEKLPEVQKQLVGFVEKWHGEKS